MATDATGSPTPLGIPKFNTSADAPSGLGFNAAMDSIDALITARVAKPTGIVSGEAMVWNGSAFVRSSVTPIDVSGLTGLNGYNNAVAINSAAVSLSWTYGKAPVTVLNAQAGGGSLAAVGVPPVTGQRLIIKNSRASSGAVTIQHLGAYSPGVTADFNNSRGADIVLGLGDSAEFVYDGANWTEVGRDIAPTTTTYRKTTTKAVNTTVTATDLLNGEITVGAGAMGTTGMLRLKAYGDWLQNSGGTVAPPRLQLVFGGTTLFDTNTNASALTGASRGYWELEAEILNAGSASAQVARIRALFGLPQGFSAFSVTFTTGTGGYNSVYDGGASIQALAQGVNSGLAVNTALAQALVLNTINGSASASYETKLFGATVEVI